MAVSEAMKRYDWLADYYWKAVAVDTDKYTASVELGKADGYFIRAAPGVKTDLPGAGMPLPVKGAACPECAQHYHRRGEFGASHHYRLHHFARQGAGHAPGRLRVLYQEGRQITFTMIHSWNPEFAVRPRTAAIIEDNGLFLSNYVLMRPVRTLQMYPVARCDGENATARFNSILVALPGSNMDVGSRVFSMPRVRGRKSSPAPSPPAAISSPAATSRAMRRRSRATWSAAASSWMTGHHPCHSRTARARWRGSTSPTRRQSARLPRKRWNTSWRAA